MFVYPVRDGIELPPAFTEDAVTPDDIAELDPATIAAHRDAWIDTWTDLVVR